MQFFWDNLRQAFPSGERVTYTGKEVLCQKCAQMPARGVRSPATSPSGANGKSAFFVGIYFFKSEIGSSSANCAGCGQELKEGQALIALERQWHIWCFKCRTCDTILHGEYMGK